MKKLGRANLLLPGKFIGSMDLELGTAKECDDVDSSLLSSVDILAPFSKRKC
jgi:hypothetical protein